MRIDRITHQVFEDFGGKTKSLSFTLSGLQQLEASAGNLVELIEKQPVPSLTVLTQALWIALGGSKKMQRAEAEELATAYMREHGVDGMVTLFYATLGASGLMGKAATDELLKEFGFTEDGEEQPNKSVTKPENLPEEIETEQDSEGKRKNAKKARP